MAKILRLITLVLLAFMPSTTSFLIDFNRSWYDSLNKPGFTPPDWVFGVVWPFLFTSLGVACFYAWENFRNKTYLIVFLINTGLLTIWNVIFFDFKNLKAAGFLFILLIIIGVFKVSVLYRLNKQLSFLLYPYLGWIIFASILNFSLISLNQ